MELPEVEVMRRDLEKDVVGRRIKKAEVIAYEDLGPEAIRKLEVEDLPAIVVNDVWGNDLYTEGIKKYRQSEKKEGEGG